MLISLQMISQEKKLYIYTDIINQVWKPFKKSFDNKNTIVIAMIGTDIRTRRWRKIRTINILNDNEWNVIILA